MDIPGSKAEMLNHLRAQGFPVPPLTFFSAAAWHGDRAACLAAMTALGADLLAVRSSSLSEDGLESSRAGAFKSVLNVLADSEAGLLNAVEEVLESLSSPDDQVIAQAMVTEAALSGVLMTRTLDDGSPYYVVNYDDVSGRTDLVTSGRGAGKTVYIYRGVKKSDFDSPRLADVVGLAWDLENFFKGEPLDIEFAVEPGGRVHLLQARPICARRHWRPENREEIPVPLSRRGCRIAFHKTTIR